MGPLRNAFIFSPPWVEEGQEDSVKIDNLPSLYWDTGVKFGVTQISSILICTTY